MDPCSRALPCSLHFVCDLQPSEDLAGADSFASESSDRDCDTITHRYPDANPESREYADASNLSDPATNHSGERRRHRVSDTDAVAFTVTYDATESGNDSLVAVQSVGRADPSPPSNS